MSKYIKIENEDDYVKDATGSHGIINHNLNAYEVAKNRTGRRKDRGMRCVKLQEKLIL